MPGKRCVLLAVVLSALNHATADAAVITSVNAFVLPGPSTGTIGPVGATPVPNNDNSTGASPNALPITVFFNALGSMDAQFVLGNSAGTTEYFFSFSFINNSGAPWTGFQFELGTGTGVAFTRLDPTTELDFDTPDADPAPSSSAFTLVSHQPTAIDWSGGQVPYVGSVAFTLSVDVPHAPQAQFTLRATPTTAATPVPEPGLTLLFAAGIAGLVNRTARRR